MFSSNDLPLLLQTLAGVLLVLLFLRWYEPRMIYYPHVPTRELERTPDEVGLSYEDIVLRTADGVNIRGWFLSNSHIGTSTSPTLLFLHGNAGNISHRLEKCRTFIGLGLDVLVIDYRGYGQSEGTPSETGTYLDADAAYEYLTKQRQIAPENIILFGESLGTGVAVDLAARMPVGAVILEAPYTSIPDVAQRIFWFLPVRPFIRNRYESLRKINRIDAPLLLLHSRNDEFFGLRHSQRLLTAAAEPKRLVELCGSHANAFCESVETGHNEIWEFLQQSKKQKD